MAKKQKKGKGPKHTESVSEEKKPKTEDFPKEAPHLLYWKFSAIDKDGPFGWQNCQCHKKYFEIIQKFGGKNGIHTQADPPKKVRRDFRIRLAAHLKIEIRPKP